MGPENLPSGMPETMTDPVSCKGLGFDISHSPCFFHGRNLGLIPEIPKARELRKEQTEKGTGPTKEKS